MASKTGKRANKATKQSNAPQPKDDGTRWIVVRGDTPVYPYTEGLVKGEAERLAEGLLEPAEVKQIA